MADKRTRGGAVWPVSSRRRQLGRRWRDPATSVHRSVRTAFDTATLRPTEYGTLACVYPALRARTKRTVGDRRTSGGFVTIILGQSQILNILFRLIIVETFAVFKNAATVDWKIHETIEDTSDDKTLFKNPVIILLTIKTYAGVRRRLVLKKWPHPGRKQMLD